MHDRSSPKTASTIAFALLSLSVVACLLATLDSVALGTFRNTCWLVLNVWAFSLPVGGLLAILLFRCRFPLRNLARALLTLALFLPVYVQAAGWEAAIGIQGWLTSTTIIGTDPILTDWLACIWIHSCVSIPWVTFIIGMGLNDLAPEIEEAATLTAHPTSVLASIIWPRLLATVCVSGVVVGITTAGDMTVTNLYGVRTFAEELYMGFALDDGSGQSQMNVTSIVVLQTLLVVTCVLGADRATGFMTNESPQPARQYELHAYKYPTMVITMGIVVALLGIPVANLIIKAGTSAFATQTGLSRHWSLTKLWNVLAAAPGKHREFFQWSFILGTTTATAATALATILAWTTISIRKTQAPVLTFCALFFSLPGPLIGILLIRTFNDRNVPFLNNLYDNSIVVHGCSLLIRALPYCTFVAWLTIRLTSINALEAARVDGASWSTQLWHVVVKGNAKALVLVWLVGFVIATGDLAASKLVAAPGVTTVSIRIFEMLHSGTDDQLSAICLWAIAGYMTVTYAIFHISRQFRSN